MGQAHRAPDNGRTHAYEVTDHAVLRLRERVKPKIDFRDDQMKSMINEAICHAEEAGLITEVWDNKNEESLEAVITDTLDPGLALAEGGAHVLLKKHMRTRIMNNAVTILTTTMARNLLRPRSNGKNPTPRPAPETKGPTPFNPALQGKIYEDLKGTIPLVPPSAPEPEPPESPILEPTNTYAILLLGTEPKEVVFVGGQVSALQFLASIGGGGGAYRLFKEVRTRVRVEVDE